MCTGGEWKLDTVCITDQASNKEVLFICQQSLHSGSIYSCKASVGVPVLTTLAAPNL